MAHRSRRALNTNPREDLSKLSSEVLKLRLQALSLPITGSKKHLLSRLKRATQVNAAVPRRKPQKRLSQPKARRGRPAKQTAIETQPSGEAENLPRWRNVPLSPEYEWQELFPIVVACAMWHPFLAGRRLQFWCDNISVVSIINSGHSKVPRIMDLVRRLVLLSMQHNFVIRARHVPGVSNEIADALSRFQMQRFRALAPDADQSPCIIPPSLMTL